MYETNDSDMLEVLREYLVDRGYACTVIAGDGVGGGCLVVVFGGVATTICMDGMGYICNGQLRRTFPVSDPDVLRQVLLHVTRNPTHVPREGTGHA